MQPERTARPTYLRGRATPLDPLPDVPLGLCGCGCEATTNVKRGRPLRYLRGHQKIPRGPLAVEVDGGYDTPCWMWLGAQNGRRYGEVGNRRVGARMLAHRAIYEEMVGPIPASLTIDHLCANTLCVNPTHLEPTTLAENTRRQWADGRADPARRQKAKTHCPHGHPYDEENTRHANGRRHCRECGRQQSRAASRRRAALRETAVALLDAGDSNPGAPSPPHDSS